MDEDEALPVSALSHLVYCERRAALVHVVGVWAENVHTTSGQLVHARVDSAEETSRPGLRLLRSVRVMSERLGLSGIIDLVEVHGEGAARKLVPVETKLGPRRRWESDEVQLCAQAMALEEMTGLEVAEGAIFHAASKRRRAVEITPALREATEKAVRRLRAVFAAREVPPPVNDARCPPCSLRAACQPGLDLGGDALSFHLKRALE